MKELMLLLSILSLNLVYSQENAKNIILKGTYLGQKPPGLRPEIFAPGTISSRYHEHSSLSFSPDGKELFYTLSCEQDHVIMYMQNINGVWTLPEPASFSGNYSDDGHVWSVDGTKLYFRSQRPVKGDTTANIYRNWVVKKNKKGWGKPKRNNFPAYTFTNEEVNYFYKQNDSTGWDIYKVDTKSKPLVFKRLNYPVNTGETDGTPFIALDGSYLIFASMGRADAIGIMDLYICFREKNGSWGKALNLGKSINKKGHICRFPKVSPDGKYLFYWCNIKNEDAGTNDLTAIEKTFQKLNPWRPENGKDGDIYWVDTKIFEKLKKDK